MEMRKFGSEDYSDLFHLWGTVFGDDSDFVGNFLDKVISPERGLIAIEDEHAVAAAFIIDGVSVGETEYPYIYAVSTLPEYRGHGLGRALSVACGAQIGSEGGIAALHPAEPSLFSWYGKMGYCPICSIRECAMEVLPNDDFEIKKISATEYKFSRESLLIGTKSAHFSEKLLQWQSDMGMEYFIFNGGCACVYCDGKKLIVYELLAKDNANSALSALSYEYKVREFFVRTPNLPQFEGFGEAVDFISAFGSTEQIDYWGFVFD